MTGIPRTSSRIFQRTITDRPGLAVPVVIIASVANGLGAMILVAASWSTIIGAGPLVASSYVFSICIPIGSVFGSWLVGGAILHLVSGTLGGRGPLKRTLRYLAWGYGPVALAGIVDAATVAYTVWGVRFPEDPGQLGPFVDGLTGGPLFTATSVVGIALLILSGWFWVQGIHHARDISTRRSAFAVAILLGPWIGFRLSRTLPALL